MTILRKFGLYLLVLSLLPFVLTASAQDTQPGNNIAIIMDASGSMRQFIGGGLLRIDVAKNAISELAAELPPDTNASLWAYGHRLGQQDPAASCLDIEEVIPLGRINVETFTSTVQNLNAIGYTPIAETLTRAAASLPADGNNTIVLMSDGEESCGGDPCAVAQALAESGLNLVVNTIGFAADDATRAQLECIAEVSGGTYFDAQNANALLDSLRVAAQPDPTDTPQPTFTPVPTDTPEPTPTLLPTATPVPATESPTPEPEVEFEAEGELPFNVSRTDGPDRLPRAAVDPAGNVHITWDSGGTSGYMHRLRTSAGQWSPMREAAPDFRIEFRATGELMPRADGAMCTLINGATDADGQGDTFGSLYVQCYQDSEWGEVELIRENVGSPRKIVAAYDSDSSLQVMRINRDVVIFEGTEEVLSDPERTAFDVNFVMDSNWVYHAVMILMGDPYQTVHRYSTDRGATWSEPEVISTELLSETMLTADTQGRLHVTYSPGSGQVVYRSWDAGNGWTEPLDLRQGQPGTIGVGTLAAGPDGDMHAAWTGNAGVVYTRQINGEWTLPQIVREEAESVVTPALAVDAEGIAHLFFQDTSTEARDLFYTRPAFAPLAVRDQTLSPEGDWPFNISETIPRSEGPRLAVDNAGNLHVIWNEGSLRETGTGLAHRLRTAEGGWSVLTDVTDTFRLWGEGSQQLVRRSDGAMCVVFSAERSAGDFFQVWQTCYLDDDFTGPEQIASDVGRNPRVVFDAGGGVHVLGMRGVGNVIYTNVSSGSSLELSDERNGTNADLLIDGNGVLHATYMRQGKPFTIVHHYSTDNGATWTPREDINMEKRISNPGHMVADNRGRVHLVFFADRSLHYRVWSAESGWSTGEIIPRDQPGTVQRFWLATGPDGTPHVAWGNRDGVFYTMRDDAT